VNSRRPLAIAEREIRARKAGERRRHVLVFSLSSSYCIVRSLPETPLTRLAKTASVNFWSFFLC
jgi:hypothetical protein